MARRRNWPQGAGASARRLAYWVRRTRPRGRHELPSAAGIVARDCWPSWWEPMPVDFVHLPHQLSRVMFCGSGSGREILGRRHLQHAEQ